MAEPPTPPPAPRPAPYLGAGRESLFFDRQGQPIDLWTFARLREDDANVILAQDTIGGALVSTIWLGIDHGAPWDDGAPAIFETMVFAEGTTMDLACWRYSTEAQARIHHVRVCELLREHIRQRAISGQSGI